MPNMCQLMYKTNKVGYIFPHLCVISLDSSILCMICSSLPIVNVDLDELSQNASFCQPLHCLQSYNTESLRA